MALAIGVKSGNWQHFLTFNNIGIKNQQQRQRQTSNNQQHFYLNGALRRALAQQAGSWSKCMRKIEPLCDQRPFGPPFFQIYQ